MDIEGKVVAVTGAGRGIGAATAQVLAGHGALLVLAARREAEIMAISRAIEASGGTSTYLPTDVRRAEDLHALVGHAVARYGRLDVMVSNAGVAYNDRLEDASLDDWNTMIDVNLRGVLHAIAASIPVFRRQRSGHFVTVTSTSGYRWVPGQGVYAATKTAVRALCEVLRQELAPDIRSTLIAPGFTDTAFIESTRNPTERAALERRRSEIAMPPSAVADAIAFAIGQPSDVDVAELLVRSSAQT